MLPTIVGGVIVAAAVWIHFDKAKFGEGIAAILALLGWFGNRKLQAQDKQVEQKTEEIKKEVSAAVDNSNAIKEKVDTLADKHDDAQKFQENWRVDMQSQFEEFQKYMTQRKPAPNRGGDPAASGIEQGPAPDRTNDPNQSAPGPAVPMITIPR